MTNHQEHQATEQFAKLSHSRDREVACAAVLESGGDEERAIRAFLDAADVQPHFEHSVRDAVHGDMRPSERCIDYRWPSSLWRQSFDGFTAGEHTVVLRS